MSSARGLAGHHLYLARLLLRAWQRDVEAEEVPVRTLAEAFGPACHTHLQRAYGWFLLALLNLDHHPEQPPATTATLPELPVGRVLPPEVCEFRQLERGGWLADMLSWQPMVPGRAPRVAGNLASAPPAATGLQDFDNWAQQLDEYFQRMSTFIEEY
ncbi:MAG: hypothetical protein ACK5ME_14035 [Parahaliea sp.]